MVVLSNVSKTFNGITALDDLSLKVDKGEFLTLIGPSGGGKTTALKMVNGLVSPSSGEVLVDGKAVPEWDPIALRRTIGYAIQQVGLFPHWTIARNVGVLPELEGWPRKDIDERIDELLTLVALDPGLMRSRYPRELSGGQAQRVGVARALALKPAVLLLDEPFGALDPLSRARLQDEFLRILKDVETTTLFVTHDLTEAFRLGHRIAVLADGRLEQIGSPQDLVNDPTSPFLKQLMEAELLQVRK